MKKGKKFIALFLVFSLFALSGSLYAKERRGAELIIQRKSDQVREVEKARLESTPWETSAISDIRGELITVKPNSLLLLDTEGKDVSIDIADIKVIRIVKKSKALLGAGIGLLIGGATGALLGFSGGDDPSGTLDIFSFSAEQKAGIGAISFGALGLIFGGVGGAYAGKDETIQIERMTDSEIQEALDKLRKKARIRDYK